MNKNIYNTFAPAVLTMLLLTACADARQDAAEGEGTLQLRASVSMAMGRGEVPAEADNAMVWISSNKGLVRRYEGLNSVPASTSLTAGHYVAEAWAGDSVAASFTQRYFKGREEFDITSGGSTRVDLVCRIANSAVTVTYDDATDQLLKSWSMTVGHSGGSLSFEGRDTRTGYFMMHGADRTLTYTFTGIDHDGNAVERQGRIENAKPNTEYRLTVSASGVDVPTGGIYFDIEVDPTTIDHVEEVVITLPPSIGGRDFDIAEPLYGEKGKMPEAVVQIGAAAAMTSVKVKGAGLDADLIATTTDIASGVKHKYAYDAKADRSSLRLTLTTAFTCALDEGEHPITITATDALGKSSEAMLTLSVFNAPVVTADPAAADVWARTATLSGTILKADASATYGFNYRVKGDSEWKAVAAKSSGSKLTAALTGLEPGTTYEYVATTQNFTSNVVKTFTTEETLQIPNGDFETWNTSSTPYLLAESSGSRYWDSGNHGSAKMSVNITQPESTIKHGGKYSAKLASQFVGVMGIGKFAAGNAFIGQYLATDGTDGILGFGRPFTSRPKTLKAWVRYEPANVTYSSTSALPTGQPDKGIVWIAITDATTESYGGSAWSYVIKTKSSEQHLFDRNDPRVIAYGEKIFTSATDGSGLVQVEIPLEYARTDVKAVNIIVVCSASMYGDYFTGGPSVLYVDDLTLEY